MRLFRIDGEVIESLDERSYREGDVHGVGEDRLQRFLEQYPQIIPSDQIDPEEPPLFYTVKREGGVTPGSIDVLLIDQKAVPTVVEAKLVDNREIRRAVLAQGLEYLAHLRREWTPDRFLAEISQHRTGSESPGADLLKDELFRKELQRNLDDARMRLIVAADSIPTELRQTIEFLSENSQFDVYGMEVRLFTRTTTMGGTEIFLAPQLIGLSERARRKTAGTSRWDEDRFYGALGEEHHDIARRLLGLSAEIPNCILDWGTGRERGSCTLRLITDNGRFSLISVYTTGHASFNIGWMHKRLSSQVTERYRERVNDACGTDIDRRSWENGWPLIDLSRLSESQLSSLRDLVKSAAGELGSSAPSLTSEGGTRNT